MIQRSLHRLKQHLKATKAYLLLSEARWSFSRCVRELDRMIAERACVSLRATTRPTQGTVLLSYILDSFLRPGRPVPNTHTHYWESLQIARTFLDLGYDVDVISYKNQAFIPEKDYAVVVDARHNLERLSSRLSPQCLKIFHIDTAHILFHNAAEAQRLLALKERRGVVLQPRRYERPNLGIEHAHCGTALAGEFAIRTFRYANKPIYRLPVPSMITCPWPEDREWDACRRRFLWFSSGGLVHKGLDLALEAFARMPDLHLTVCAPIESEDDFRQAFQKELYGTPNIRTIGWLDVNSRKFLEITRSCCGVLHASCSEGCGTAVIQCMHAGLIPIVSYESGVDVQEFGFLLRSCSIQDIQDTVRAVAALPVKELKERSRRAWEFARANHTRERFVEEYWSLMTRLLASGQPISIASLDGEPALPVTPSISAR